MDNKALHRKWVPALILMILLLAFCTAFADEEKAEIMVQGESGGVTENVNDDASSSPAASDMRYSCDPSRELMNQLTLNIQPG